MTLKTRKILTTGLLFLGSILSYAQQIEVKGTIIDEATKTPIDFATIQIEETKNHRLLGYGFSDENGKFQIETDLKDQTEISLVITYIGFTTYKKAIPLNNSHLDIGEIILHESTESLDEIVITAKPPILMKNDTMQFNAGSFTTKEDAVAEDLLKKLPGVSIDNDDGTIQVNGIDVTRILVNGEPFFSNNPKVAMKIISKDIIEKIEITNSKSDEEEFTGTESEEEAKTINIILKKKDNGNIFGNATGGYGSNNRYEANAVVNRMQEKSLFTLLAFSNNVNKNNFSYDDDSESNLDKSRAIKTENNVGLNYSDKLDGGDKVNFNYMFSNTEYDKGTRIDQKGLIPNSINYSIENSDDITQQNTHNGELKLTNNIFKNFRLITNANIFYKDRDFDRKSDKETKDEEGELVNQINSSYNQSQTTQNIKSSINAVYKFEKLNSFISYQIATSNYSFNANSNNISTTNIFGNNPRDVFRNQQLSQKRFDTNIGNTIRYNQRFLKRNTISYEYSYKTEDKEESKEVYDYDTDANTLTLNDGLTFNQLIDVTKKEHKISYDYRSKSIFYNIKASNLKTNLENNELNRDLGLKKSFDDFLFSTKFRYAIKRGTAINASYRTKSIIPRNNELITITDNSNPLRINMGNPDLKRELEHLLSINFRTFNQKSKIYFFNRFSYTNVTDKIIDKTSVDEDLVTTRTYINNSDNNKYNLNGSISKDYKKSPLFYNFKLKWYASMGENTHYINDVLFKSDFVTFSPSFYSELNYNDILEISPSYRLLLDETKYDTDVIQDQSNIQHTFGLDITTFAPKRFTLFNQMQYNLNPKFQEGYGKQSLVWNVTANYSLVPEKAKLKLTVFNILNQYNNTTRRLTESRNSTYTYDVLKQYVMLSFKYIFKNT